jgi:hypothetical protein
MPAVEVTAVTALPEPVVTDALEELARRGVLRIERETGIARYSSDGCALPYDDPNGWEAAVFDHYQAMVGALCAKLNLGTKGASRADVIGGSTFGFEVWPGHPHYDEVRGLLQAFRTLCGELRERVATYNQATSAPPNRERVITYFGQNVLDDSPTEQNDDDAR